MTIKFLLFLLSLSPRIEEWLWKWWYQRLAAASKTRDLRFMNYGYAQDSSLPLNAGDEENRLFIQLYHHTLSGVDLQGKRVLEVGSGRGGGTDYVARYLAPSSIIGVDIAKNAVDLCNQFYSIPSLRFVEGAAEKLPFANESFDVVYNVESSHCYGNMQGFIAEVTRVLKPGGIFAWADLRTQALMETDDKLFMHSSLALLNKENITSNVLSALDQISNRKKELIQRNVPYLLRPLLSEFTGVRESKIYRGFQEGKMVYWCYHLQKSTQRT